jgi:hypothetical protein
MNAARIVFFAFAVIAVLGVYLSMGAEVIATRRVVTLAGVITLLFVVVTIVSIACLRKHE